MYNIKEVVNYYVRTFISLIPDVIELKIEQQRRRKNIHSSTNPLHLQICMWNYPCGNLRLLSIFWKNSRDKDVQRWMNIDSEWINIQNEGLGHTETSS